MTEDSRTLAITFAGAVLGGAAAFLLFTDRGRALSRQFDPALDEFAQQLGSFRSTIEKAAFVGTQAWSLLNDATRPLNEGGRSRSSYPGPHQTSPF